VLKQMLEGYLNQVPKTITNLQQQANMLSQEVLNEVSMYKPSTTAAEVRGDGVDGVDGEIDDQETPRPVVVDPMATALPTRKK